MRMDEQPQSKSGSNKPQNSHASSSKKPSHRGAKPKKSNNNIGSGAMSDAFAAAFAKSKQ